MLWGVWGADSIIRNHISLSPNALKTASETFSLTQKQMAEISGISFGVISAYEQGRQPLEDANSFPFGGGRGTEPERIFQCCAGGKKEDSQASFQKQR